MKAKTARLDKLLGSLGYGSRQEIARLARIGGVALDGVDVTDASTRIAVTPDLPRRMTVDGRPVDPPQDEGEDGEEEERRENQAPGLVTRNSIEKEGTEGGLARYCLVHVVDGDLVHDFAIMALQLARKP